MAKTATCEQRVAVGKAFWLACLLVPLTMNLPPPHVSSLLRGSKEESTVTNRFRDIEGLLGLGSLPSEAILLECGWLVREIALLRANCIVSRSRA